MKIDKIKINGYGKLKNKEIKLTDGINIIYGKNESGKSTLINFIINSLYGISKNKKGKEISDFEKYKPWKGEDFSGKIEYELDNNKKYEIFRDFNKKNPKIFDENMEDISKQFNIDKNKGNEFFYEQTKIDEDLFLSTLAINQLQVKLEDQEQNILIQKIANLAQTGDDTTSFKRVIDRINRRQLDEVGTERSREKPINLITKKLEDLNNKKEELEKYKNLRYEFEENENLINNEIFNLENENNLLKEIKLLNENQKIEKEKIKIQEDLKNKNSEKINLINDKIELIKNNKKDISKKYSENKFEKDNKRLRIKNNRKNKLVKNLNFILILLIIINIFQFILIKNNNIKYLILLTIPVFLILYVFLSIKENKKLKIENSNLKKLDLEINNLENEKRIIENNNKNIEDELTKIKNNLNLKNNLEKEKIKNNYLNKIEKNRINDYLELNNLETINFEIEKLQKNINDKKLKIHSINLDKKNIEPQLDNLSNIEEEIFKNSNKITDLNNLNYSMNLAKEVLYNVYEKMKNSVTPKFTKNLSKNISTITEGKYNKVMFNEGEGLIIELEDGNYIPANRFSIGTIDQLYLSLRLSMIDELSDEKVPIFLDETFAFYDEDRLKNILLYLSNEFKNRQIIIFTCTEREKNILLNNEVGYNYIEI